MEDKGFIGLSERVSSLFCFLAGKIKAGSNGRFRA
jgi:hypothetical protein